jgi:hypothetical protein
MHVQLFKIIKNSWQVVSQHLGTFWLQWMTLKWVSSYISFSSWICSKLSAWWALLIYIYIYIPPQLSWKALRYTMKELYRHGENCSVGLKKVSFSYSMHWTSCSIIAFCCAGDVLHLVHVIPRDMVHVPVPLSILGNVSFTDSCVLTSEQMELALCEHAELFIAQCMVELVGSCHAQYQVDIIRAGHTRDSIGETVCKAAERLQASLIVVPGDTPKSLADFIFRNDHASFGAYVAAHSSRPTLIFQPDSTSWPFLWWANELDPWIHWNVCTSINLRQCCAWLSWP